MKGQQNVLTSMGRFNHGLQACILLIAERIRRKVSPTLFAPKANISEAARRTQFLRESYAVMFYTLLNAYAFLKLKFKI